MSKKLIGLDPVLPKEAKVLILGSMPSQQSLIKKEYYGNPRNHFWKIMEHLFGQDLTTIGYKERIVILKEHHIGLWDSIHSCDREGSLDSNIKNEEPNDMIGLLRNNPSIQLIACNGRKSYQTFQRYFSKEHAGVEVIKLPSSSPIPGKYNKNFVEKVEDWKIIEKYVRS